MKKKPIFLVSTALAALLGSFASPLAASAINMSQGVWTAEELDAASIELNETLDNECHGDYMCQELYMMELYDSGADIFKALTIYESDRLVIKTINPSQGTINLVYRDRDPMMSRMGMDEKGTLNELYLVRFEQGQNDLDFPTSIQNETLSSTTYVVLNKTAAKDGNWLTPNQETTISLENFSMRPGIEHRFWYFLSGENSGYMGYFDYSDCINSPDYKYGSECKVAYNKSKAFYIPMTVQSDNHEQADSDIDKNNDEGDSVDGTEEESGEENLNAGDNTTKDENNVIEDNNQDPEYDDNQALEHDEIENAEGNQNVEGINASDNANQDADSTEKELDYNSVISMGGSVSGSGNSPSSGPTNSESLAYPRHELQNGESMDGNTKVAVNFDTPLVESADSDDSQQTSYADSLDYADSYEFAPATRYSEDREYPWWLLVAIIISGIGLLIWWIIPTRSRRRRDS